MRRAYEKANELLDLLRISSWKKEPNNDRIAGSCWGVREKRAGHGEAIFKQLRKYGNTLVLHPLNSNYEDIELKKGHRYRIVGKVVKKEKRY